MEGFGPSTSACAVIPVLKDATLEDGVCALCRSPISTIQVALKPHWLCPPGKIDSLSDKKKKPQNLKMLNSKNAGLYLISTLNVTLKFFVSIYTCCFCTDTWKCLAISQFHTKWIHVLEQHIRSFFKLCYLKKKKKKNQNAIFLYALFLLLLSCYQDNLSAVCSVDRWGKKSADVKTALALK